jgi:LAS superfamily LD-carboxypeptidase LdcB
MSGDNHVTTSRRRSLAARLLAAATVAALPVLAPSAVAAQPGPAGPATQRDDVGPATADDGGALQSAGTGSDASLDGVSAEVEAEVTAVVEARTAQASAEAELAAADVAVDETRAALDELTVQSDLVVVEAFVNPPVETAIDALSVTDPADATVKQSILTTQANENADVLTRLSETQDDLAAVEAAQRDAADLAAERATESEAALADLQEGQSAAAGFVLAVQDGLADALAEADALAAVDPAAAEELRARQGEIAALLGEITAAREQQAAVAALQAAMAQAAERAAADAATRSSSRGGGSLGSATGSLATVSCPAGGSITVDSSLAGSLQSLLDDAAADGENLCGGGYRDPAAQIALREQNCGTSDYAIYEAPSSSCSPPTARPGTSNHEQGLAIDFTCNGGGTLSSSSPCFSWLQSNAAAYGLYNLPSEPWHWSTDGT